MATTRKSRTDQDKRTGQENVDETVERIRDLNERILDSGRKVGKGYLDAYERALTSIADFEERLAGTSQIDWVSAIANAQASFIREIAKSYSAAGRDLLK
jgi:hypothetical protein